MWRHYLWCHHPVLLIRELRVYIKSVHCAPVQIRDPIQHIISWLYHYYANMYYIKECGHTYSRFKKSHNLFKKRDFKSCTFTILRKINPHDAEQWPDLTVGSLTHRVHNSAVFKVASLHASIYSYAVQLLKLHVFGRIIMNPSYNLGSLIKNLMSNCTEENSPNYNKIKWLIFILSEWEVSFYAVVIHHVVYLFLDDSFLPLQGTPIPEITRAVLGFSGLIYCLCYLHGTPIPEMSAGDIAWWKCCLQYKSEKLKTNKKQKPKNTMKM